MGTHKIHALLTNCDLLRCVFAGLSAAKELQNKGHNVVVLEARDRVGGRTCTVNVSIAYLLISLVSG